MPLSRVYYNSLQHTTTSCNTMCWMRHGSGVMAHISMSHGKQVGRGGRKALLETLHTPQKKTSEKKPIFTNLKKRIRAHRASGQGTRLILTKNKSNINQCERVAIYVHTCIWHDSFRRGHTSSVLQYATVCCNALLCLIRIMVGNSDPVVSQDTLAVCCSVLKLWKHDLMDLEI